MSFLSNGTAVDDPFDQSTSDNIELTVGRSFLQDQLDVFVTIDHTFANDDTNDTTGPNAPSDSFTLYDLGIGYTPTSGALEGTEFRASINNITDEQYRQYGSSRVGEGRNLIFSVAKTF